MKKLISIILTCVLMLSMLSVVTYGAAPEQISPMWDNAHTFTAALKFTQTTGKITVTVVGQPGVTNISAEVKLYYKNSAGSWVKEEDWTYDADQMYLTITESFTGTTGVEYKIEVEADVYKEGSTETLSRTVTAICPNT